MRRLNISHGVLAFALLVAGCSSVSYNFDYDRDFNFSGIQTYGWAPVPDEAPGEPLTRHRIAEAVNAGLTAKGYAQSGDPDFRIAVHVGSEEKVDVMDWGYGPGRRWRGGRRDISVYNYTQGTMVLDMIDVRANELVWRGTATGVLSSNPTPEERTRKISEVVQKLLAGFPPSLTP